MHVALCQPTRDPWSILYSASISRPPDSDCRSIYEEAATGAAAVLALARFWTSPILPFCEIQKSVEAASEGAVFQDKQSACGIPILPQLSHRSTAPWSRVERPNLPTT